MNKRTGRKLAGMLRGLSDCRFCGTRPRFSVIREIGGDGDGDEANESVSICCECFIARENADGDEEIIGAAEGLICDWKKNQGIDPFEEGVGDEL